MSNVALKTPKTFMIKDLEASLLKYCENNGKSFKEFDKVRNRLSYLVKVSNKLAYLVKVSNSIIANKGYGERIAYRLVSKLQVEVRYLPATRTASRSLMKLTPLQTKLSTEKNIPVFTDGTNMYVGKVSMQINSQKLTHILKNI